MKFLFKTALFLSCFALSFVSCNKDDDNGDNQTTDNNDDNKNEDGTDNNDENEDSFKLIVSGTVGGHGYVDLGLSSGTLWATCNVGATTSEEYGDYFSWGETETKPYYTTSKGIGKYEDLMNEGIIDGVKDNSSDNSVGRLTPDFDVATVKWGDDWRMPTLDDMKELYSECSSKWTTINGVDGNIFVGTNGNALFLPAAGYREIGERCVGTLGCYWTSSSCEDWELAFYLGFDSKKAGWDHYRTHGLSIRPVVRAK